MVLFRNGHITGDVIELKTTAIPPILNGVVGNGTFPKRRLIEVDAPAHTAIFEERLVVVVVEPLNKDTEVFQKLARHR